MAQYKPIYYSAGADEDRKLQNRLSKLDRQVGAYEPVAVPAEVSAAMARSNDEAAGRLYLQTYLEDAGSETLLEITSPERAELVPDMSTQSTTPVPQLQANAVVFQQTAHGFPVFGGRVVVDVDSADKSLVEINGKVTPFPSNVEPFARISAHDAFVKLAEWSGQGQSRIAARPALKPPVLTWFLHEETEKWHLAYHFTHVPIPPRTEPSAALDPRFATVSDVCLGCSPRTEMAAYDYFVDAHDGAVVFYYSSAPHIDVPSPMLGQDSRGNIRNFFGLNGTGKFLLADPLRKIETYDYANADIDGVPQPALPKMPISHSSNDLAATFPAAVAAHYNAQVVWNFYNDVLKRNSVDDKGMKLVSVVNVYSSNRNPLPPPQWRNAVWWNSRMWYGQVNQLSLAEHLDVIGHELTHGVTETSSNLIYRDLPGALNESYSDIFGVIIANWYPAGPNPLMAWDWRIGAGLASNGGPLRDFSNPAATGQPDHFSQYVPLPISQDNGGVHIYSGIHNKAVFLVLTGKDAAGNFTFPVAEAALLLYLTLTRLTPTSKFIDSRRTLENVTRTYYASDPAVMAVRLAAIDKAFGSVGIV